MRGMRCETRGLHRHQSVRGGGGRRLDLHRADLAPARVIVDAPAERMRDQLMSVTDPEQRHAGVDLLAQPCCRRFAPRQSLADHRRRSGDDDTRVRLRRRQRCACVHAHDIDARALQAHAGAKPVRKIAATRAQFGVRAAGLDDQETRALSALNPWAAGH